MTLLTFPQSGLGAPERPVAGGLVGRPAVVGREEDDGVVQVAFLFQSPRDVGHSLVQGRDHTTAHAPVSVSHMRAVGL